MTLLFRFGYCKSKILTLPIWAFFAEGYPNIRFSKNNLMGVFLIFNHLTIDYSRRTGGRVNLNFLAPPYGVAF